MHNAFAEVVATAYAPSQQWVQEEWKPVRTIYKVHSTTVFCYLHIPTQKYAAVKIYNKEHIVDGKKEAILNEFKFHQALRGVSGIVRAWYFIEAPTHFILVTEYIEGGTLREYIHRNKGISEDALVPMLASFLITVRGMHKAGVLHLDIKPENVLIHISKHTGAITWHLCDFGSAMRMNDRAFQQKIVGTPAYMAPEVREAMIKRVRPHYCTKTDIWSIGVMVFEALHAHRPQHEDSIEFSTKTSCKARLFIRRCMAQDHLKRPSPTMLLWSNWLHAAAMDLSIRYSLSIEISPCPSLCPPTEPIPKACQEAAVLVPTRAPTMPMSPCIMYWVSSLRRSREKTLPRVSKS